MKGNMRRVLSAIVIVSMLLTSMLMTAFTEETTATKAKGADSDIITSIELMLNGEPLISGDEVEFTGEEMTLEYSGYNIDHIQIGALYVTTTSSGVNPAPTEENQSRFTFTPDVGTYSFTVEITQGDKAAGIEWDNPLAGPESRTFTFTVIKRKLTAEWTDKGSGTNGKYVYTGNALTPPELVVMDSDSDYSDIFKAVCSQNEFRNAGDYTFTAEFTGENAEENTKHYEIVNSTDSHDVTVHPAKLTPDWDEADGKEYIYNSESQGPSATKLKDASNNPVDLGFNIIYSGETDKGEAYNSDKAPKDSGNYTASLTLETDAQSSNNFELVDSTRNFKISTKYQLQYDPGDGGSGSMEPETVAVGDMVKLPECSFIAPPGKNFYKWQISGVDGIFDPGYEYTVAENSIMGNVITVTATWKEAPPATVTAAPTAKNPTYNGTDQELVTAGAASGGVMSYAIGNDSINAPTSGWNVKIPKKAAAGTYYVWYKAVGDVSHSDTVPKCVTVTIAKQNPKVVTEVTVNAATVNAKAIDKAVKKAGTTKAKVKTIVLGSKVRKIGKKAFKSYKKTKTLIVRTKKLKKSKVKGSLKGSKITKIKVQVGSKKANKKYVKKYKKNFKKKIVGKKVKVML